MPTETDNPQERIAGQLSDIVAFLEERDGPAGSGVTHTAAVAEEIGASRWVARQRLRRLEARGTVAKKGDTGIWYKVPGEREAE